MTLDMTKVKEDRGDSFEYNTPLSSYYCSRGLEDFHIEQKGCLKTSTVQRRQNAIRAVLNEQESQRQQYMQLQGGMYEYTLDHAKTSEAYKKQTYHNAENAIYMGRCDSEEALAVYSEPSPQLSLSSGTEQEPGVNITNTNASGMNLFRVMTPNKQWSFSGHHCATPTNHTVFV